MTPTVRVRLSSWLLMIYTSSSQPDCRLYGSVVDERSRRATSDMFTFKQTLQDLRRHPVRTLLVSILIAVLMVASAGIYAMSMDVRHTISEIESTHSINAYLLAGLDQTSIQTLLEQMQKDEAVARAEYVSPADGLKKLETQYPQFASVFSDLTRNPIPPLIRVYPVSVQGITGLAAELRSLAGVQTVEYDEGSVQGMANANVFVHSLLLYMLEAVDKHVRVGHPLHRAFVILHGLNASKRTKLRSQAGDALHGDWIDPDKRWNRIACQVAKYACKLGILSLKLLEAVCGTHVFRTGNGFVFLHLLEKSLNGSLIQAGQKVCVDGVCALDLRDGVAHVHGHCIDASACDHQYSYQD